MFFRKKKEPATLPVKVRVKEVKEVVYEDIHNYYGEPNAYGSGGGYHIPEWVETKKKFDSKSKKMKKENFIIWESEDGLEFKTNESYIYYWTDEKKLKEELRAHYNSAFLQVKTQEMKDKYIKEKIWITI